MVLICFDSSPYVSHSYPDEISPYVERLNPHAPLGWHWNARKPWGFNPHLFGSLTFTNNWCRYIIYIQCNIYIYIHIYLYYIIYHIVSIYTYILYMCVLQPFSDVQPEPKREGLRQEICPSTIHVDVVEVAWAFLRPLGTPHFKITIWLWLVCSFGCSIVDFI